MELTDLSPSSGQVAARVTSPLGWIEGRAERHEGLVVLPAGDPLRAELAATRPLGEELIGMIHPALGDIRSSAEPVRITLTDATFPTDGDLRPTTT